MAIAESIWGGSITDRLSDITSITVVLKCDGSLRIEKGLKGVLSLFYTGGKRKSDTRPLGGFRRSKIDMPMRFFGFRPAVFRDTKIGDLELSDYHETKRLRQWLKNIDKENK